MSETKVEEASHRAGLGGPSPTSAGVVSRAVRLIAIVALAAVLTVGIDAAVAARTHARAAATATPYALSLGILAGVVLAGGIAVLGALGELFAAGPRARRLPLVLGLAAVIVYLNRTLFDGPWVAAQSWAGAARVALYAVAPLVGCVLVWTFDWSLRRDWLARWFFALVALAGAAACAYANLALLGAYPLLKVQFSLGTLAAIAAAIALIFARRRLRPGREALLAVILIGLALAAGVVTRKSSALNRVRATIAGVPFPSTHWVMVPAERLVLARLAPTVSIRDGGWSEIVRAADPTEVQARLDEALPQRKRLNVLWIAIDALRADHVKAWGYRRATTPNLDALTARSIWFTRAVTPTPMSALAYSGTLTGLLGRSAPAYQVQHATGVEIPTDLALAAQLKAAGRRTMGLTAFHASTAAQPVFAVQSAGFDVFNAGDRGPELDAEEVTDRALALLSGAADRPFFAWVHYMDPHGPYQFRKDFDFGPLPIDAYDGEIAHTDREIARLLAGVDRLGLADRTVIVVFADHGEAFGEHNSRRHGANLYQHQVHVPLIVFVPGLPARRVDQWVSLADLAPTMLSLIGVQDPHPRLGRDLTPLMLGNTENWVDTAYVERPAPPRYQPPSNDRAVFHGDLKLIWKPHDQTFEVFDVVKDPGEVDNLFNPDDPDHQELLRMMRGWDRRIDAHWGEGPASGGTDVVPVTAGPADTLELILAAVRVAEPTELGPAMAQLDELLGSPSIGWTPSRKSVLGPEQVQELADWFAEHLAGLDRSSGDQRLAFRFMLFNDDPRHLPVLIEESRRVPASLQLELLSARARHGDRAVLPILEHGWPEATSLGRLSLAEALAHVGDDRGRGLLEASLDLHPTLLLQGVRGLEALGDHASLRRLLISIDKSWRDEAVLDALLPQALVDRTAMGNAALNHLANAAGLDTAAAARTELEKRIGPERMKRADRLYEAVFGAREAAVYNKPDLVLRSLGAATPEDDDLLGPIWWLAARAAWAGRDEKTTLQYLDRVVAAVPDDAVMQELVRRVRAHVEQNPSISPRRHGLVVTVASPIRSAIRGGRPFWLELDVKNDSDLHVPGGTWRTNFRLGIAFEPVGGGEVEAPSYAMVLPLTGLEPGETRRVVVLGRFPSDAGRYVPQIAVIARAKASPRAVLLELPPLDVP